MSSCVYDNPATMSREFYDDGKMVCTYTAELLCSEEMRAMGFTNIFGAGDWNSGQLIGDIRALGDSHRAMAEEERRAMAEEERRAEFDAEMRRDAFGD